MLMFVCRGLVTRPVAECSDYSPLPRPPASPRKPPLTPCTSSSGNTDVDPCGGCLPGSHEDWVHSVAWAPPPAAGTAPPCLLSASMDRTMMLWQPESSSSGASARGPHLLSAYTPIQGCGLWVAKARNCFWIIK